ncbi:hypothetical protein [Flaviflexus massiliensis]|uniref:hypothetical protein n=1 Tax=Flaviflexus massiliensis TaxID=1522309 RepID=UPI000B15BD5A|nr:hypothetical protein [Flaviflexus massiliensis]
MEKLDVKKEPHYKGREGVFQLLEVPDQSFLMIDGSGDPNTSKDYELSLEALYLLAYALKFMSKNELERDYVVPPLEGLW